LGSESARFDQSAIWLRKSNFMFYSRPNIAPLRWDLAVLPEWDGYKNFEGVTSEGDRFEVHFSGGWITVERAGAEVLSEAIAPFGTMDMTPEQVCDVLGLTVRGERIDTAGMRTGVRGYDWSGRTTYWQSTHLLASGDDAREFVAEAIRGLQGSLLVQADFRSHGRVRVRRVKFLMDSDELVYIGLGGDLARIEGMLEREETSWDEFETAFGYAVEVSWRNQSWDGPRAPEFSHRKYRVKTSYQTADQAAQEHTRKLLAVMEKYFFRKWEAVNLATGAAVEFEDPNDEMSYSADVRDLCLEKPGRYLLVKQNRDGSEIGFRPAY
jgi:hypothetical protein